MSAVLHETASGGSQMTEGISLLRILSRNFAHSVSGRPSWGESILVVPGVLQHGVNLGPSQIARTPRLIRDTLGQPPDDRCCLSKRCVRLHSLASFLIQVSQRRLDLPLFCRQAEVGRYLGGLAQVADGLLAVPIPRR